MARIPARATTYRQYIIGKEIYELCNKSVISVCELNYKMEGRMKHSKVNNERSWAFPSLIRKL